MAADAARVERDASVAAAVRAEEREFAASLHDTAAATLLMVGIGQVREDSAWLAAQARRDLDRLRSGGTDVPRHTDLVRLLHDEVEAVHLDVVLDAPTRLPLPSDVAAVFADATREALNNVRRHAGTTRASIRLGGDQRRLRLDIADTGKGFSPEDVPATRRGLRESVHGRLTRIGGTATVISAVGEGTVVRLEWRDAGMSDDRRRGRPRAQLLYGLRVATLLVAAVVVFGLGLTNLLRRLGFPRPAARAAGRVRGAGGGARRRSRAARPTAAVGTAAPGRRRPSCSSRPRWPP